MMASSQIKSGPFWHRLVKQLICAAVLAIIQSAGTGQAHAAVATAQESLRTDKDPSQKVTPEQKNEGGRTIYVYRVALDNTGVADWDFVNPRRPALLWTRGTGGSAQLLFSNTTSARTMVVTLPTITLPAQLVSGWLTGSVGSAIQDAQLRVSNLLGVADELTKATPAGKVDAGLSGGASEFHTKLDAIATGLAELTNELAAVKSLQWDDSAIAGHVSTLEGLKSRAALLADKAAELDPLIVKTERLLSPAARSGLAGTAMARLHQPLRALESSLKTASESGGLQADTAAIEREHGAKLKCTQRVGAIECVPTLTIAANTSEWISGTLLDGTTPNETLKFRVSFFDEIETPVRSTGFASLDVKLNPAASSATWTALGVFQFAGDPSFGAAMDPIDDQHPYRGNRTNQFKSIGRAYFQYLLGSRAEANIEFQFKNNALGAQVEDKAEDLPLKANTYSFVVYGMGGATFRFGKYVFAQPTDGLAIREVGEGATVRFRWFGLSHVVRRESAAGTADIHNQDHRAWIAEVNSIAIPTWSSLRSVSLIAVRGDDLSTKNNRQRRYYTGGGEAQFGIPTGQVDGVFAYYYSQSRPRAGSMATEASGYSWLSRLSKTWFASNKPQRTISVTMAQGSGDKKDTPQFEGYVGESAPFNTNESLYSGGLTPRLRLDDVPMFTIAADPNVVGSKDRTVLEFARKPMMNRRLFGAVLTDQTFSPLEWVASALQIPQGDIESRQTTIRLLQYGFVEQVQGTRRGSTELQLESLLESPAGVRTSVRYSRLLAKGPLEAMFPEEPWAVLVQCAIAFK